MHPRQAALLARTHDLNVRLATKKEGGSPVMWKYVCPDTNQEFYLGERKTSVKSPFTGKAFSTKPEKMSLTNMVRDIKEENQGDK